MLAGPFYDKYGNFDNKKFIQLLKKAQKAQFKEDFKASWWPKKQIILFASVSKKELWQMLNKFSIFINSGIDIKWALSILAKQTKNPLLKNIVVEMKMNIDHGISIHDTMMTYPKAFDSLTIALIEVWEKTGQLGNILAELDQNLLESIELKWKVKWAMIYPMILLGLTICMVVFMMIFIVPRITESFAKTGSELPAITQFVVAVSDFLTQDWAKVILILFWIFITVDAWVLLLEALKTSSKVVPNLLYKKELIRIKNEVEVWLTISKSLWLNLDYETSIYVNQLFSEEFAYVVSTWEETWSLSESLKKIGKNYNSELKRYIENLSSMMEPIIIVVVGILVGTIVIAIMLPFFELWKVAKKL